VSCRDRSSGQIPSEFIFRFSFLWNPRDGGERLIEERVSRRRNARLSNYICSAYRPGDQDSTRRTQTRQFYNFVNSRIRNSRGGGGGGYAWKAGVHGNPRSGEGVAAGHPVYTLASRNSRNAILMPSPQIRGRDVDAPKYMRHARARARARECLRL